MRWERRISSSLGTVEEVEQRKHGYNPRDYYEKNSELKQAIDQIQGGFFCPNEPEAFKDIVNSLLYHDTYMLLADFESYVEAQERVSELFKDREAWAKKCIMNIASSGKFSSDRTITQYAREIWGVEPNTIKLPAPHETPQDK
ncbi:putative glycogen phosphorylase, brain form [Apostichopus japonicus]|uniref:Alpha-1,4 glucan phosphorylase n=1 Tax=Stichopus japonicus TaxID=307972 RepID=A0A2G8KP69_STIJA|nr:putative glycogen phosphorylase, brain form [Apostichopus japonicus]